jgi:hypothetical protein
LKNKTTDNMVKIVAAIDKSNLKIKIISIVIHFLLYNSQTYKKWNKKTSLVDVF